MNKQRWINILVVCVLLLLVLGQPQKAEGERMAVTFPDKSSLNFGVSPTSVSTPAARTWMAWIKITAAQAAGYPHIIVDGDDGGTDDWLFAYYSDTGVVPATRLAFMRRWLTQPGIWHGTANLSLNTWYHVAVTYDESNIANDPVFYLTGAAVGVSEGTTPEGALDDDDDATIYLGGYSTVANYSKIVLSDVRIYNRILTAAEILAIYENKCHTDVLNGLIFAPQMYGAAGLQSFDGATLAAGNTIVDPFSHATGVPAGSPTGTGETFLRVCP